MNKPFLLSAIVMLPGSHAAFAADSNFVAVGEFEPMVVTASRTAETADEALTSVTIVTRNDIERLQAYSVQDLLRGVPGISIANNGGSGKNTSLFLRGTEADHVLVLIDGVKVGSATSGTTAFQHIPVDQVERIEIVRGPRSSLYGSEAIGGVIQIFTRKGGGAPKSSFSIGAGSYNSSNASIAVSDGGDQGWFSANASFANTDGFNSCNGKPGVAGCFTTEPDKDGYNTLSGSLRAGYRFENGFEIDAHALHIDSDTDYDGSSSNQAEAVQKVLGASFRYSPVPIWQVTLNAGWSLDDSRNFKEGFFDSRFETERDTVSLQNDIAVAKDHLLTLGADYQDDRIDSTTAYAITSRNNKGLFFQYQGMVGAHKLQVSLREDDNEQFDKRTTGGLAWGYPLTGDLWLTASYGTAFKAPTFNELYYPGGNPDLKPEQSRSFELGLGGERGGVDWSLNVYESHVDELIAYDAAVFSSDNVEETRIRGIEFGLSARVSDWMFVTNLTFLEPENLSEGDEEGNILARRAEQSLRLDVDRSFGRSSIGGTLLVEGRRYDDLANIRRIDGYTTLDLRFEYRISDVWLLQARIENLFDEAYETAAFYNQPKRSLFATVRYQP